MEVSCNGTVPVWSLRQWLPPFIIFRLIRSIPLSQISIWYPTMPKHMQTVTEFVVIIQELDLCRIRSAVKDLSTDHILDCIHTQPHSCKRYCTDNIWHINDRAENFFPLIPLVRITANKRDRLITTRPPIGQIRNRLKNEVLNKLVLISFLYSFQNPANFHKSMESVTPSILKKLMITVLMIGYRKIPETAELPESEIQRSSFYSSSNKYLLCKLYHIYGLLRFAPQSSTITLIYFVNLATPVWVQSLIVQARTTFAFETGYSKDRWRQRRYDATISINSLFISLRPA